MTVDPFYNRGAWRLTLHARQFSDVPWTSTLLAEIAGARGRRLEQTLNKPARLTFTVDGHSDAAKLVREMQTDVIAWRWDPTTGAEVPYFRGIVAQGEDQLTEQNHVTTFTCHDYFAVVNRRYLTSRPAMQPQTDQDAIVVTLMNWAGIWATYGAGSAGRFMPGSYLPLVVTRRAPDNAARGNSGELRDRTYVGGSAIGELIDNLANVMSIRDPTHTAFDYDVVPGWKDGTSSTTDLFRVFYPQQGVDRPDVVLEYGGNVSTVTRSANSADYANYVRVIGNNGTDDPLAYQLFADAWTPDANDVTRVPVGLWMNSENASDVTDPNTLAEKANGDLNVSGVLVPSYSLGLRPGTYHDGFVNMGDTVPVVIKSGRLDVASSVRIVGLAFDLGDDDNESVSLTVGRPATSLFDYLRAGLADVDALARR